VSSFSVAQPGRPRALFDFYVTAMRTAVQAQLQYRVNQYFWMLGWIAEPVIYLVVWTTIAEQSGGSVDGNTAGYFAAYYIVWTLVRNMNFGLSTYAWEWRIREGILSGQLLRPLHPIHYDLAFFAGWKFVAIALWIPIAIALSLLFEPTLDPSMLEVVVFAVAIWGAYLIRSLNLWALGTVNFWTTRGAALSELYIVVELLLSGRLVPLQLLPDWAQTLAGVLPFKWTFYFPIEALIGDLSQAELAEGLAMQVFWTAVGTALVTVMWRRGIRRYSAVNG